MLTQKELSFIQYWETVREKEARPISKLLNGLPMAAIFALPIILFLMAVYIWLPDWFSKISDIGTGSFVAAIVAVLLCILFFAYFRMHFKWEMNEQLYKELRSKQSRKMQQMD